MKKILSLILSLLILYISLDIYLTHSFNQLTTNLSKKFEPYLFVSYKNSFVEPLRGQALIEKINIKSPYLKSNIKIDKLILSGLDFNPNINNFNDLYHFNKLKPKKIILNTVERNTEDNLFEFLKNIKTKKNNEFEKFNFLNLDLEKLGYHIIHSNLELSLDTHSKNKNYILNIVLDNKDMFEVNIKLIFQSSNIDTFSDFKLLNGNITYKDLSLIENYIKYQSKIKKIETDKVVEDLITSLIKSLKKHIVFDNNQLEQIKIFLKERHILKIEFSPFKGLDTHEMKKLNLYNPVDIPKVINLTIKNSND